MSVPSLGVFSPQSIRKHPPGGDASMRKFAQGNLCPVSSKGPEEIKYKEGVKKGGLYQKVVNPL